MTKVNILQPDRKTDRYDVDYYCGTHVLLSTRRFGTVLRGGSLSGELAKHTNGGSDTFFARFFVPFFAPFFAHEVRGRA